MPCKSVMRLKNLHPQHCWAVTVFSTDVSFPSSSRKERNFDGVNQRDIEMYSMSVIVSITFQIDWSKPRKDFSVRKMLGGVEQTCETMHVTYIVIAVNTTKTTMSYILIQHSIRWGWK